MDDRAFNTANLKTLEEIKQKTIARIKSTECLTQNEEIAYLVGLADGLSNIINGLLKRY